MKRLSGELWHASKLRWDNRWNKEMYQFTIVFGRVRTFKVPQLANSWTIRPQCDSDTSVIFSDGSSAISLNLTGSVNFAHPSWILGNVVFVVEFLNTKLGCSNYKDQCSFTTCRDEPCFRSHESKKASARWFFC